MQHRGKKKTKLKRNRKMPTWNEPKKWIGQSERRKIDPKHPGVGFLMWMSGSLCLIHPPYSIRFCPPHLILFISWVFQLLNQFYSYTTLHLVWMERFWVPFSSTWQHQLSTSVLLDVPYLEPVPFMDSVFLLTLWMPDCSESRVNVCVNVFFSTLIIMLSSQNTDYLIIITSQS